MTTPNETDLLKILEAHGQQFLNSFPGESSKKRKIDLDPSPPRKKTQHIPLGADEEEEEEWLGISESTDEESRSGSEDDGGMC